MNSTKFFYPYFGSARNSKVTLASRSCDSKSIYMGLLGLDGSLLAWDAEVAKFTSALPKQEVSAAGVDIGTSAVAWVLEDGSDQYIQSQLMTCLGN